ncbi:hypothetical protein DIPPA_18904 [Diplonema papillatum]|nr:hypothetical protein DIPPA_18904 [Diplonema papillatum]
MEAVAGEQPILEILNLLREAATATLTSHEHTAGVNGIASAAAPAEMGAGAGAGPSSSSAGTLLSMAGVLTGTAITLAKAGIIPVPWGRRKRADEDEDPDMVLGKKLIELKRYADAIQAFDRVVARNPRHKNAYNNRAVAYFFEGMYETCVHDCDAQIEVDPKGSLEAWSNKALALEKLDENVDALDAWTRALEIASSLGSVSPHLYVQRAQLQIKLGENGDAYDDFCRALELDGEDPDAHAGKADALLRSGDNLDEALACVQEAVSLAPDCSEVVGFSVFLPPMPDQPRSFLDWLSWVHQLSALRFQLLQLHPNTEAEVHPWDPTSG